MASVTASAPALAPSTNPIRASWLVGLCVLAAGFNLWGVSHGWRHPNLEGVEFRQTHTAISAYYIQQDHDFSLAYPTPVMGKPWSVPMEFPLYQWTVVLLSDATHLPLQESGRLVSVLCFYGSLAALFLLLRWLGLRPVFCLIPLSLVLACPLYIFYSRAFLIETMALMFSLWYAVGLTRGAANRFGWWLLVVNLAGIGAGLVKVTTFLVFIALALVWSLVLLWRAWPRAGQPGWARFWRMVGWLAAAHAVPFAVTLWWLRFADAVKSLNATGSYLRSDQLRSWNFGYGKHLDPATWRPIWQTISEQVIWPPVLIVVVLAGLFLDRRRGRLVALLGGVYAVTLFVFPVLYSAHPYYQIAAAILPLVAIGLVVVGVCESTRLPRFAGPVLLAVLLGGQAWAYAKYTYPQYDRAGNRGPLAEVLRDVVRPYEPLVIAGDDWSPILPYYSEHRALLIRASLSHNPDYLRLAFAALRGEEIGALVLFDDERDNRFLLDFAVRELGIDPEPALFCEDRGRHAVIYFNRWFTYESFARFHQNENHYFHLTLAPRTPASPLAGHETDYAALPRRYQELFADMTPRPERFFVTYGAAKLGSPPDDRFSVHPQTRLWFKLRPGPHVFHTDLSLPPVAWENQKAADTTDGVEAIASVVFADGRREILQRRLINPWANPADRGLVPLDWTFDLPAGATFEFSVTPGPAGNIQRDWASMGHLRID